LLRSILRSGSDPDFAKAVDYGKRIAFYPLFDPPHWAISATGSSARSLRHMTAVQRIRLAKAIGRG
jgi:hypothetical protein